MSSALLLVEFFSEGEQRLPEAPEVMGSVGLQGSAAGISLRWVPWSPGNSHAIEPLGDENVIWGEDIIIGALGQLGLPITFLPPQHSRRSWQLRRRLWWRSRLSRMLFSCFCLWLPLPLPVVHLSLYVSSSSSHKTRVVLVLLSGLWPSCCPPSRWTDIGSSVHPCHCERSHGTCLVT